MLMVSEANMERVLESLKAGRMDAADISEANLVDKILCAMQREGISQGMAQSFTDVRERRSIPFDIIMLSGVAAKMKVHMSLTDIPMAIQDTQTLAELGYCLWESEREVGRGLMDEGSIRYLAGNTDATTWFEGYNGYFREHLLPNLGVGANIHILDCTKVEVNMKNGNYEGAGVVKDPDGSLHRGYKLATLRGIYGDTGMIEEVRFGSIETHDLTLSKEMVLSTPLLKEGDVLVMDRGFLSREVLNALKRRGVDVYIPLRKGMEAYEVAVSAAKMEGQWHSHPNDKRKEQRIAFAGMLGAYWQSEKPEEDVPINGCVVWDTKKDDYYVFVTTDTNVRARQLLKTYELRPEIEEDFRQVKDFWKLEDFRSRKLPVIAFHLVCTLLGYLFFQVYIQMEEGKGLAGKSLPVALKHYEKHKEKQAKSVIVCIGQYFAVFALLPFIQLYASLDAHVRARLDRVLALV